MAGANGIEYDIQAGRLKHGSKKGNIEYVGNAIAKGMVQFSNIESPKFHFTKTSSTENVSLSWQHRRILEGSCFIIVKQSCRKHVSSRTISFQVKPMLVFVKRLWVISVKQTRDDIGAL